MEFRVFGPPGTGKTTYLAEQINKKIISCEYNDTDFLVLSFTKAAAHEIASRGSLRKDRIGTIHSIGAQSAGLNAKDRLYIKFVKDWNGYVAGQPSFLIKNEGTVGTDVDESPLRELDQGDSNGDELLSSVELNRHRCKPLDQWTLTQQAFWKKWQDWKEQNDLIDFADMIDIPYQECASAPGNPRVIMVDEAQDLTTLQSRLVRAWGKTTDYYILCGDDDQTIYEWAGASPKIMLEPSIPETHKIILKHSHRVPSVIKAYAETVIKKCSSRQDKEYNSTADAGEIHYLKSSWQRDPTDICSIATELSGKGESVMILAQSSYMLAKIIREFREQGIPFHNPYRIKNGTWNPIRTKGRAITGSKKLTSFLAPIFSEFEDKDVSWNWVELNTWSQDLSKECFNFVGAKKLIADRAKGDDKYKIVGFTELADLFKPQWHIPISSCDSRWLEHHLISSKAKSYEFPLRIFNKNKSLNPLLEVPKIIIGTIHSVKGGEADNVILIQDISPIACESRRFYGDDPLIRLNYVGITRARKRLYLVDPNTRFHF